MATSQNPITAASASVPPVPDVPVVPASPTAAGPPKTAAIVGGSVDQPAKALDQLSDSAPAAGLLEKVQGYVDKLSVQAKPYVDNAGVKIDQFIDRIEGAANSVTNPATASTTAPTASTTTFSSTTTAGTGIPPTDKSVTGESTAAVKDTASTASANASAVASTVSEKAQGLFAAVQSNIEKLTHTIDEKTSSPSHPGIITQISQAVEKGFEKVDQLVSENQTTAQPPVQTTTNTVPHLDDKEPVAGTSSTTGAGAPVLGAAATTGTRADLAFAVPP